jgi:acylphosphatase
MDESQLTQLHAVVHGYVQGVGFRGFVMSTALGLDLKGWVRNVGYDQVEVIAEGSREILDKLLFALHQGPRMSQVDKVEADWNPYSGEFSRFSVEYDTE